MRTVTHLVTIALSLWLAACISPTDGVRELAAVDGECFLLRRLDTNVLHVSNPGECNVPASPASTFKIPHALIALETGVLAGASTVQKWDGTEQPFETWARDHSLASAMKSSVVWFFRRTAAAIGGERMTDWLGKLQYSTDTFERDPTYFWLDGDLVISPREQLDFLSRLFRFELPVERRHVDVLKQILVMPPGRISNAAGLHGFPLAWGDGVVVRAKTGNTRVGDERVSWLVGHLSDGSTEYVFVSRVCAPHELSTVAGAAVALRHLNAIRSRL